MSSTGDECLNCDDGTTLREMVIDRGCGPDDPVRPACPKCDYVAGM